MTNEEYMNFMNLSMEDKKFVLSGMNEEQLNILYQKFMANEYQVCCEDCQKWVNVMDDVDSGICTCRYSRHYHECMKHYEGCYGTELEQVFNMLYVCIQMTRKN